MACGDFNSELHLDYQPPLPDAPLCESTATNDSDHAEHDKAREPPIHAYWIDYGRDENLQLAQHDIARPGGQNKPTMTPAEPDGAVCGNIS